MPREFSNERCTRNYLWLRWLHLTTQKKPAELQNAAQRQNLPSFEGKLEKQKLPRQILPIRIYPDSPVGVRPKSRRILSPELANSSCRVAPVLDGLPV
jgi:hypothetical protein